MYYVIKGPAEHGQYLCEMADHSVPQWWHKRALALTFATEDAAWRHLERVNREHADGKAGRYVARVVCVTTKHDHRARVARLLADNEELRHEIAALRKAQPTNEALPQTTEPEKRGT